jgi:hypothetical protein
LAGIAHHWNLQQGCKFTQWICNTSNLTTMLPFESLSDEARKADVLPGLRPNSLISVSKIADANYTTIFHPRRDCVTVHKKNTFWLQLLHKPVLQGWRDSNGLWRLSRDERKPIRGSKRK